MKVLLIQPAKAPLTLGGEDYFLYEPLALEYLAAGVSAHHDVEVLDMRLEKDLGARLGRFRPDVVGVTAYTVHVNVAIGLCEEIKRAGPDVLTVVGGHHASVAPEAFRVPAVDVIVRGEGVVPLREILARREKGQPLAGVPGTVCRDGETWVESAPPPPGDLDLLPFPDRKSTAPYRREYFSEWMRPLASLRTSRGCPFRCNFCALWKLTGGRYLRRAPEKIVEELGGLEEEFVFFSDDESLIDAKRMRRLADLIRDSGIRKRYFLYGRSDTIARNPDLLAAWKEVGLERVFVGLESFRERDLSEVKKSSTLRDNAEAVRILQDLDLSIYGSFIVMPEYGREDFQALRKYCRDLGVDYPSFAVLTPLPGTDLWRDVEDRMITRRFEFFDFIHTVLPTALPLKDFYREFILLYKKSMRMGKRFEFLRRFPLRELPSVIRRFRKIYRRMDALHSDHDVEGAARG